MFDRKPETARMSEDRGDQPSFEESGMAGPLDGPLIRSTRSAGRWGAIGGHPARVRSRRRSESVIAALLAFALLAGRGGSSMAQGRPAGAGEDPVGIELFEKAIRPVLADRCSS